MPIVDIETITRPEELVEYLADFIGSSEIPFNYVAKYDEQLIPEYPCVQIQAGTTDKFIHGTHTFVIALRAYLYIMHSKMTDDKRTRNLNDMLLATDVVNLLEADLTLGGRVINGFVDSETPAAFPPRSRKGDVVVGTRLLWNGIVQTRFK